MSGNMGIGGASGETMAARGYDEDMDLEEQLQERIWRTGVIMSGNMGIGGASGETMAARGYDEDMVLEEQLQERIWRDKMHLKIIRERIMGRGLSCDAEQRHAEELARRKRMCMAKDGILKWMLKMIKVDNAQGFVYGIIPENGKPITGASDNLRQWWKDEVRFDTNGPNAIAKYNQAD